MSFRKRSMLGVTLLEIMLVLAIAGMIIVMSVRYYQAANTSSQANDMLQRIQAIIAAEVSIFQASSGYVDDTGLTGILGTSGLKTPWATSITVKGGASSFTISFPGASTGVCSMLLVQVAANPNITNQSCAPASASFTYGTAAPTTP